MHCFWGMVSIYNWRGFSGPLSEEGCLKQGTLPHCKFDPLDNQRQHHPPHHREVKKNRKNHKWKQVGWLRTTHLFQHFKASLSLWQGEGSSLRRFDFPALQNWFSRSSAGHCVSLCTSYFLRINLVTRLAINKPIVRSWKLQGTDVSVNNWALCHFPESSGSLGNSMGNPQVGARKCNNWQNLPMMLGPSKVS